jgi:hypothetical protein
MLSAEEVNRVRSLLGLVSRRRKVGLCFDSFGAQRTGHAGDMVLTRELSLARRLLLLFWKSKPESTHEMLVKHCGIFSMQAMCCSIPDDQSCGKIEDPLIAHNVATVSRTPRNNGNNPPHEHKQSNSI